MLPLVIVGVESGNESLDGELDADRWGEIEDIRQQDYIYQPDRWDDPRHAGRYDAHLTFALDEAMSTALDHYGLRRGPVVVAGWSNGGVWAAHAFSRRTEVVRHSISMSPGAAAEAFAAGELDAESGRSIHFSAGRYEPDFLKGTQNYWSAAREAGVPTDMVLYADGHNSAQWQHRLVTLLPELLKAEPPVD